MAELNNIVKRAYSKPIVQISDGNLAIKTTAIPKSEYEKPKVLKLVIGKKENKIFCGCWQVANKEDAC